MRMSQFWSLMEGEFGAGYAHTLARHQVLGSLGGRNAVDALEAGVPAREVWQAVCDAMDVPESRRLGEDVTMDVPRRVVDSIGD
ncbi:DUF3046 domain-containing protein [Janibacter melonis]|nr:DUF3046 domain-containing protein [Janibacter melonis]MCB5993023.1 DUF3046 domain-containing protein [Janibacter melonis]